MFVSNINDVHLVGNCRVALALTLLAVVFPCGPLIAIYRNSFFELRFRMKCHYDSLWYVCSSFISLLPLHIWTDSL